MLAVLDVFTPAHPTCTADEIAARLGYSRGTAYRYIRSLCAAGLLARTPSGVMLGPRIIEMDLAIRRCDPVLAIAEPLMQELRDRFDCDMLLVRYYDQRVVVSHHERGAHPMQVTYGRGHAMPLFLGAGSKAILSALPFARQRRLYAEHAEEIARVGLGADWRTFRARMLEMERAGVALSRAELDLGNVGIGAPIPAADQSQPSALVMVFRESRYEVLDKEMAARAVREAAGRIGDALAGCAGKG